MLRYIVRPVREADLEQVLELALSESGMTSLPKDRLALAVKIECSVTSFEDPASCRGRGYFLFVLEDTHLRTLAGLSALTHKNPEGKIYHYCHPEYTVAKTAAGPKAISQLILTEHSDNPLVACSYLMRREYRSRGLGRLLSLSRFLYVAEHPEIFPEESVAEMRGPMFGPDLPLFWECFGQQRFGRDYARFQREYAALEPACLKDLTAAFPIPYPAMPRIARDCLGRVHPDTRIALRVLREEGFRLHGDMDFVDGGPIVRIATREIRTVRDSAGTRIDSVLKKDPEIGACLVAGFYPEFRAVMTHAIPAGAAGGIGLSRSATLTVGAGLMDRVRYIYLPGKGAGVMPATNRKSLPEQLSLTTLSLK